MQENYKPYLEDITKVYVGGKLYARQVVCAANNFGDFIVLGVRHFCPLMRETLDRLGIKGIKHVPKKLDEILN